MSTTALATLPPSCFVCLTPVVASLLATQPENWSAFGASIAATLITIWNRERSQPLTRRVFSFISTVFGGWCLPPLLIYNAPKSWLVYVPLDAPQTWALLAVVCGIASTSLFMLFIIAVESAFRRTKPRLNSLMNVIGPDPAPVPITNTETPEQLEEALLHRREKAARLSRRHLKESD